MTYAKGAGVIGPKSQGMKGYQEAMEKLGWPMPDLVQADESDVSEALSDEQAAAELAGEI